VQQQDDHVKLDGRSKEDVMESTSLLDCAGRRRSPATTSSFHEGLSPRNKGLRYPPDPPTVEEIVSVMHAAGENAEGVRLRCIIVVLWRAGLRISEALALSETDVDPVRGSVLIRHGKGGLCRIRHRPPYVALGTMLRSAPGVEARPVDRVCAAVVGCVGEA
jgi:integrase